MQIMIPFSNSNSVLPPGLTTAAKKNMGRGTFRHLHIDNWRDNDLPHDTLNVTILCLNYRVDHQIHSVWGVVLPRIKILNTSRSRKGHTSSQDRQARDHMCMYML
eukprot:m.23271 g.23271  ORF g.23271 m.23271 type:complete len:105 (-) comp10951_c0_seq2:3213-3527(-)